MTDEEALELARRTELAIDLYGFDVYDTVWACDSRVFEADGLRAVRRYQVSDSVTLLGVLGRGRLFVIPTGTQDPKLILSSIYDGGATTKTVQGALSSLRRLTVLHDLANL